jgi:hypothetical protein
MNVRVDLNYPIKDGTEVVFRSPVDCSQVTGLIVYYLVESGSTESKEFAFADAHGNNVGDIDHLFAEDVVVKVILDVTKSMAFVQNADTNAYLEGRFAGIETTIDNLCPSFTESGAVVTCEPVEGYPLQVVSGIVPKQSGSGTPSPENIRPISGHDVVKLTHSGDTFTRELGQTIYGGSFHWGSGTLTNGWYLLNVKDLAGNRFSLAGDYVNIPFYQDVPAADANNRQLSICSHLSYGSATGNNVFWLDSTGTGLRLKVDGVTTKEAYMQWVEENEPMVAYPLATTTTSQLTPQEFKALAGANTIYSDTGDTTVTGKANPAAEIEKLKNAILAMGGNV